MVICPKCCEYYTFHDVKHELKNDRYVCIFSCDCEAHLRIEESEAERKGFFSDEDSQDALHERKFEIIQAIIRNESEQSHTFLKAR